MSQDITMLLHAASAGDRDAAEELMPIVYSALRKLAVVRMSRETPRHTLQPTALVHEAYLRLVKDESARFENRRHFFSAAAEAMRRILIDRARRHARLKHGAGWEQVPYCEEELFLHEPDPQILVLDQALRRLEEIEPRKAEIVKLRYFVGLTIPETAEMLGVSPGTVKLDWAYARAWLHREIADEDEATE